MAVSWLRHGCVTRHVVASRGHVVASRVMWLRHVVMWLRHATPHTRVAHESRALHMIRDTH